MEYIESIHNAKIKEWTKLQSKKGREKAGTFLIEGEHLVEEAIKSKASIEALLISQDLPLTQVVERFIHTDPSVCFQVSDQIMKKLSETETPQGIIAVIQIQSFELERFLKDKGLLVLLDAIQDPGNLGTIIRTADAAGVDGIVLGKGTVDLYNSKVVRSTMGSIFHIPIVQGDLKSITDILQQHDFSLIATSLESAVSYDQPVYQGAIGIVIGNEAKGVSAPVLQACSTRVKIPIYGQAESLNAAIAAGIIIYEAIRQRK